MRLIVRYLARLSRKHRIALFSIAAFHLVLFFPTLFMGRLLSPNDVFFHYAPWSALRPVEAQNPTLDSAATEILTLVAFFRREPVGALHWNPYLASGVPGYGSSVILSPFILLPAMVLPLPLLFTGIILLKINFAFFFAYAWLREERFGKGASAFGAITLSAAGIGSVWWLMYPTNAMVLYPALLWMLARLMAGRPVGLFAMTGLAFLAILPGFPAMVAYGLWTVVAYGIYLAVRKQMFPGRAVGRVVIAVVIAGAIASPFVTSFAGFLSRTGYFEARSETAALHRYPLRHLESVVQPFRLGDPAAHLWIGDPALGDSNDFVESTLYVGLFALPLALAGLFRRRTRHRWFWVLFLLVILFAIVAGHDYGGWIGSIPGIRYSPLTRLRVLLPIPFAYLGASGVRLLAEWTRRVTVRRLRLRLVALCVAGLALGAAVDLSLFAARFYPYVTRDMARVETTPTIELLRHDSGIFRVMPFFTYLEPNIAEMFGIEDIRSHFRSETRYRRMMEGVDPGSFDQPTVLLFNSLHTRLDHPFLSLLNVRYFVEQPNIDIIRWSIYERTRPGTLQSEWITLRAGGRMKRTIDVSDSNFWAIEIPLRFESATPEAELRMTLFDVETGARIQSRVFDADELRRTEKAYLAVRPRVRAPAKLELVIESRGMVVDLLGGEAGPADDPLFYGRVEWPVILDRELPEGRIFRNLAELPRFRAVWESDVMSPDLFLESKDRDVATRVALSAAQPWQTRVAAVEQERRAASVEIHRRDAARFDVTVDSAVPFLLASSEKLTPELRVTVDGLRVEPVEIDAMFAGVLIEPGRHEVRFVRRIGGMWWPVSGVGLLAFLVLGIRRY